MEIKEPEFKCAGNWQELASLFGYEIEIYSQYWTYEIAEPERIDEYTRAYDTTVTNGETKFSLMEMIFQSLTEQKDEKKMEEKWDQVKSILNENFDLHKYTIYYWCCWENEDINDCWEITPLIRDFWINKK